MYYMSYKDLLEDMIMIEMIGKLELSSSPRGIKACCVVEKSYSKYGGSMI